MVTNNQFFVLMNLGIAGYFGFPMGWANALLSVYFMYRMIRYD